MGATSIQLVLGIFKVGSHLHLATWERIYMKQIHISNCVCVCVCVILETEPRA
jgi:hypothetical protein